jgi:hypothetical protein
MEQKSPNDIQEVIFDKNYIKFTKERYKAQKHIKEL